MHATLVFHFSRQQLIFPHKSVKTGDDAATAYKSLVNFNTV